jgi:MFS family permease
MAQTIEAFVGSALDEAKISPLHRRVIALIAAGYFFDVIDFTVFGSLVPYILQSKFASGAEVAAIGSATIFGMFIGTAGQGEFSDRFGRRFIYQFNLLLFGIFTILGAFAPSAADRLSLCRRDRARRRAAALLRLCGRIFAQAHPWAHPGYRSFHWRRLRMADWHGARASFRQRLYDT